MSASIAAVRGCAFYLALAIASPRVAADTTAVRGVVRAEASAVISSELIARISAITFKPGQPFHAGDTLLRFDCQRYEADVRAAEAEVRLQQITVDTNRQLLRHRATGVNDLAMAEAKHAQAAAQLESLRARVAQCVIVAPYEGHLVERLVDIAEMPQANAPLLKIVKSGRLEIDLIVPSQWSMWLKPGDSFTFAVDETGSSHQARVLQTAPVVDPVSRTMKVTAQLTGATTDIRPGMSGTAKLAPTAKVSPQ
jgi:membrane fusion protein, multidrug efflux system